MLNLFSKKSSVYPQLENTSVIVCCKTYFRVHRKYYLFRLSRTFKIHKNSTKWHIGLFYHSSHTFLIVKGAGQGMHSFPLRRGGCWRKRWDRVRGRGPQLRAQRPRWCRYLNQHYNGCCSIIGMLLICLVILPSAKATEIVITLSFQAYSHFPKSICFIAICPGFLPFSPVPRIWTTLFTAPAGRLLILLLRAVQQNPWHCLMR